ncbi:hypothetical protein [Burkholderia cepacia]|uniref:hypothetical protein n=1 Tax=Burkholderia cepacia TaxID=292 RepID=UPI00158867F5|nr:hypothetical protein [Burkholderia cepacia]
MDGLPRGLRTEYRSNINRFLCHLEQQDSSWSQLVPTADDRRPAALEQAVNAGIRYHGLQDGTRAALNQAFGLLLQGESGRVALAPTFIEHTELMGRLPQGLSQQHHSAINRFLCHLERQGYSWSQLVPTADDRRPAALEQAVNAGMLDHGLDRNTRTALNQGFGLLLQGAQVALSPTFTEHIQLMDGLPRGLRTEYRSRINRFLCHLEQQDSSWSQMVPANSGARPAALEQAVNEGIRERRLHIGTRALLNQAFGLELQGESGRVTLSLTFPEHTELMNSLSPRLRPDLSPQYRSATKRFLRHLEQQDSSWSQLVPTADDRRPAALAQAVNEGMREHGLQRNTRAALNRAFGLLL